MITPPFESVWPDVERRLRALLYRRGLDRASAEDVVQEVALRALAGRVTYTSAKDLLRWAGPVACNLHVDLVRQRARLTDDEVGTDHPATNDVAGEVADRIELQRAFRGIAALRPADREAIIEAVSAEPVRPTNRKEAVRLAVRRHRARSRLALVMEQLAGVVLGWRWLRPSRQAGAAAVVPVVLALPLLLVSPAPVAPRHAPAPPAVSGPVTRPMPVRHVLTEVPDRAPAPRPPARQAQPRRAPAPRKAAPVAERPDFRRPPEKVVDVTPRGYGVTTTGHDRPPNTTWVVCVWDLPVTGTQCV